jgi:hypothetical protein
MAQFTLHLMKNRLWPKPNMLSIRLWKKNLTERESRLPVILTRKYKIKRILPCRFR